MCIHRFKELGTQTAKGVGLGIGLVPVMRLVKQCTKCMKIKYISLTLGAGANDNYMWQPIIKH